MVCGDRRVGPGEECDTGDIVEPDGCTNCEIDPGWACTEPTGGASVCSETCGDGLVDVEAGEECDDAVANSNSEPDACRENCRRAACGDGVVDAGEACDRGDANSDGEVDGCRTTCDAAFCGDGVIDTGERCDPGGGVPGAAVAGACTTMCGPDAGPDASLDPDDPPTLSGGACAVGSGGSSGLSVLWGLALALLGARRRRRRTG